MYLIVTGTVRPLKGQNAQSEQDTRQASGKQAAGSAQVSRKGRYRLRAVRHSCTFQ
ncbi:hypothetical protein KV564_21380 [Paenibacillus chitinolyticus]|nr:hypothetical protein [Paenibacillus chitinolyticus]